jgi:predicted aldo/keto reductase-like oxidoreductase
MQYRNFGKTGFMVSALGMGCMRLPYVPGSQQYVPTVDRDKAIEMLQYAASHGVNYYDTAFGYHGGTSEEILGEAVAGFRDSVWLTTKQPFFAMKTRADIRRNLESTLTKLRTDYIDLYLMHAVGGGSWEGFKRLEAYAEYEKFKAEGLIKRIGFSYHGNYQLFKEVVSAYPWDMCQVQYNMLDINREVTDAGLAYANKLGVAVVVMEPLRGGGLAQAPEPVQAVYDSYPVKRSPAEWAFRHVLDKPEVAAILSGMTTLEQLKENIETFSRTDIAPGCLSADEKSVITDARKAYESIVAIPCTGCNYCMPCPQNVNIPGCFATYNLSYATSYFAGITMYFQDVTKRSPRQCVKCGKCEKHCPQHIKIMDELENVQKRMEPFWLKPALAVFRAVQSRAK